MYFRNYWPEFGGVKKSMSLFFRSISVLVVLKVAFIFLFLQVFLFLTLLQVSCSRYSIWLDSALDWNHLSKMTNIPVTQERVT